MRPTPEIQLANDAHQQAVFQKAQELLRDRTILVQALSQEGMTYLNENSTDEYLEDLANMVVADDANAFGRHLLDQVIHYVWAIAEQEVSGQYSALKH
ncbi:MAG: hypothetical protein OQL16_10350 [Gammaproteobacteria bacterium]|nr:hypothetical protein [Gammaproteobacteria bacterium]